MTTTPSNSKTFYLDILVEGNASHTPALHLLARRDLDALIADRDRWQQMHGNLAEVVHAYMDNPANHSHWVHMGQLVCPLNHD